MVGSAGFAGSYFAIWRALATPAIFIAWGIASLVERSLSSPILVADWLIAVAIAGGITAAMSRLDNVRIDRARQLVSLSGSAFPIIRNLLIFAVKYGLGVALVLAPAFRYELSLADTAVSGATAGYFLDWLARFAAIYQRAADPIVAPARQ
jgi:hypothetical protein